MLEEILNSILPNILEIIVTIISIIVARYVIPCIKEDLIPWLKGDLIPWLKEKRLYGTIKGFVQAVEKMAESGAITKESKKQKVIELLESKGIVVTEEVSMLIESAVKELDLISSTLYDEIIIEPEIEFEIEDENDESEESEIVEPEVIIETENV